MPTLKTKTFYDEDRGLWIARTEDFCFIESEGDTAEEARAGLSLLLEEIQYGSGE